MRTALAYQETVKVLESQSPHSIKVSLPSFPLAWAWAAELHHILVIPLSIPGD